MTIGKDKKRVVLSLKTTVYEDALKIAEDDNRTFSNFIEKLLEDLIKQKKKNEHK